MDKVKLFTHQIAEYHITYDGNKDYLTKEYAKDVWLDYKASAKDNTWYDHFCTPIYTSYRRAVSGAKNEGEHNWYFIIEYRVSLKELEELIMDNNDEKSLKVYKVHPLVFNVKVVKEKI